VLPTMGWLPGFSACSGQHAWHSCRAGCIVISENPQGLATHMVHRVSSWQKDFVLTFLLDTFRIYSESLPFYCLKTAKIYLNDDSIKCYKASYSRIIHWKTKSKALSLSCRFFKNSFFTIVILQWHGLSKSPSLLLPFIVQMKRTKQHKEHCLHLPPFNLTSFNTVIGLPIIIMNQNQMISSNIILMR